MVKVVKSAIGWIPAILLALPVWAGAAESWIDLINDEAKGGWFTRESDFSRLSDAQKQARLGLIPPNRPAVAPSAVAPLAATLAVTLPSSFDWRNTGGKNFVTSVRDQGDCGGCWAFATAAALESKVLIAEDTPGAALNLSEQILLACSGAGDCKYGGDIERAAYFVKNSGTSLEACYPYSATNGYCSNACNNWKQSAFRVSSYSEDHYHNPYTSDPYDGSRKGLIKNLVYTKGPAVVAFSVYSDFYNYGSGVYRKTSSATWTGGHHAVTVVGWDDTCNSGSYVGGCFIVKNSWKNDWGEDGYFRIAYDQLTSGPSASVLGSTTGGPNFGWWIVSLGDAYRVQPLADLQCTIPDIYLSGSPVLEGDPITVEAYVLNAGAAEAPASTAHLFLSADNDGDLSDDTDLGVIPIAPLAVGYEAFVQWNVPAPAPPGATPARLWPIIRVDDGNDVTESNEGNNLGRDATASVTVEPPAWVQVKSPNGGKALYRGKTYAFAWGSAGCGTVTVQLLKRVSGSWVVKKTLATGVDAALGAVSWKVGKRFPTGSYYKARVTCADEGSALFDESDRKFSIKAP